jgi:beta-N-acetylhexosaminidase
MRALPIIFGISGAELTSDELAFLKEYRPVGIILFSRNIAHDAHGNSDKVKLRKLCADIREHCPYVLIDQEGGPVQRLQRRNCYLAPAAGTFSTASTDALRTHVSLIDRDLIDASIDVNCAPVCDLLPVQDPSYIGSRSFGSDRATVASLAAAWTKQAAADGIISVLKHCPGHGATAEDSHKGLPTVRKSLAALRDEDFGVFRDVIGECYRDGVDSFWIMTAHILYPAVDAENCATLSPMIIRMIRDEWGFRGKIITDCVRMKALKGELWEKVLASLRAGCDFALCSSAGFELNAEIAQKVREYVASKRGTF